METVVHLVITGMIVLQPVSENPGQWRVTVPNFTSAAHHKHVPHILVETKDLVNPPPGSSDYVVYIPDQHSGSVASTQTTGSETFPEEMLTYYDLCAKPPGECAKIKDLNDAALILSVGPASLETTGSFPQIDWYLERRSKGKPVKTRRGEVAEEVCLTFKIQGNTLPISLEGTAGISQKIDIELKADASNRIELLVGNTVPSTGKKHQNNDPHLHLYYGVNKDTRPADKAELKNDQQDSGKLWRDHCHKLSLVEVQKDGTAKPPRSGLPLPRLAVIGVNPGLELGPRSLTGSNCPPVGGDPWP